MLSLRRLNPLTDPSWDTLLTAFPDATIFHSSAWARVLHESYRYDPTYLILDSSDQPQALLPLVGISSWLTGKRGVSLPFTDACAPLSHDHASLEALLAATRTLALSQGWKYLEFRGGSHFFAGPSSPPPASHLPSPNSHLPSPNSHLPSTSYWSHHLPLVSDLAALFSRLESSTRRAVRKAEQQHLQIEVSTSLEATRTFYDLLCLTRQRHGVPPQSWAFFQNLHRHVLAPGEGCVVLARNSPSSSPPQFADQSNPRPRNTQNTRKGIEEVPCIPCVPWARSVGTPIAGAVFLHSGKTALYKYGASDEKYQHLRANNLVMWHGIAWHAQRGFTSLDFGRTSLSNEGLRRFKLGWGTEETRLDYTRIDPATGRYLTAPDRAAGWHTRIFQKMPLPLARLVGQLLYRHMA